MRTKEINAIVDSAYSALQFLNNKTWTAYRDRCYDMACEEERGHRRGAPNGWSWPKGASVNAAARMFVVKRIAEELTGERPIKIADILHTQGSAVYAAALVANFGDEIRKAWSSPGIETIAALKELDYVQFVNDGEKP